MSGAQIRPPLSGCAPIIEAMPECSGLLWPGVRVPPGFDDVAEAAADVDAGQDPTRVSSAARRLPITPAIPVLVHWRSLPDIAGTSGDSIAEDLASLLTQHYDRCPETDGNSL